MTETPDVLNPDNRMSFESFSAQSGLVGKEALVAYSGYLAELQVRLADARGFDSVEDMRRAPQS